MNHWQRLAELFSVEEHQAAIRLTLFLRDQIGLTDFEAFASMPAEDLAQIFPDLPPGHPWRLPPSPDSVNNMLRTAAAVLARAHHVLRREQRDVSQWEALAILYPAPEQDSAWQLLDFLQETHGLADFHELADLPAEALVDLFQELPEYHPWRLPPSPDSVNNMLRQAAGMLARARHVLRREQRDVSQWEALATLYPASEQDSAWHLLDFLQETHGLVELQGLADLPADVLVDLFQELPEYHSWRLPPSPDSVNNMLRQAAAVLARAHHVLRREQRDVNAWEALVALGEPEEQGDVWILLDILQDEHGMVELVALAGMPAEELAALFPSLPEYHGYHRLATDAERLAVAERLLARARDLVGLPSEPETAVIEFVGQLLDEASGEPVAGLAVRGYDLEVEPEPQFLGQDVTDGHGLFALYYRVPAALAVEGGERKLRLEILDPQEDILQELEIVAQIDQPEPQPFSIAAPIPPPLPTIAVADVVDATTATVLSTAGVETLEDVLRERELLGTLSLSPDSLAILEKNANLSLTTVGFENAMELNQGLIEQGYSDLSSIANTPRGEFVSSVSDQIPESLAVNLHGTAAAQDHLLNSLVHGALVEQASGRAPAAMLKDLPALRCTCRDCESAVSPAAYLADLLHYATTNVRIGHAGGREAESIDLERLAGWFHQPFGKLPASCDAVEESISLVRIVVEALQSYLKAPNLPKAAHKEYLWAVYETLLGELGTSYEELRMAVAAGAGGGEGEKTRQRLADRIGVPVEAEGIPDVLAWMLHDPASLSEEVLQDKFGLASTDFHLRPTAAVDSSRLLRLQLDHLRRQWALEDADDEQWPANWAVLDPTIMGLEDMRPEVYEAGHGWLPNPARTVWEQRQQWLLHHFETIQSTYQADESVRNLIETFVWAQQGPWSLDEFLDLRGALDQEDGQRGQRLLRESYHIEEQAYRQLMGLLDKQDVHAEPLDQSEVALLLQITLDVLRQREAERPGGWIDEEKAEGLSLSPRFFWVSSAKPDEEYPWQRDQKRRQAWQQILRDLGRRPLLDPDLVRAADLEQPYGDDLAFRLWDARSANLMRIQTDLRSIPDLDDQLRAGLGVEAEKIDSLAHQHQAGEEVEERLGQLGLSPATLVFLARMRALPSLLDREKEEIVDLLVQVIKERDLYSVWRDEEVTQGLSLSPDYFTLPPRDQSEPFVGSPWRAPGSVRRDWEKRLRAREEMIETSRQALRDAVAAAEQGALPMWRDALVDAYQVPEMKRDMTREEKGRWLTDRLQIEILASPCRTTTRVGQAIETMQGLIFGIRSGRLHPFYKYMLEEETDTLALQSEAFEQEWRWLESYATWRAAVFVFLYPENLLLPTLRRHQTPAFRRLVEAMRDGPGVTPEQGAELATQYADYVRDVASLELQAACQTYIGRSEGTLTEPAQLFVFGRGGATGSIYWLTYDPNSQDPGYEQSFWDVVPGLPSHCHLVGAMPYQASEDVDRFIYLFAVVHRQEQLSLVCARYNLCQRSWEKGEDSITLALPQGTSSVAVKQTAQEKKPPLIFITVGNGIWERSLDQEGTSWEEKPGDEKIVLENGKDQTVTELDPWSLVTYVSYLERVLDVVEVAPDATVLIYSALGFRQKDLVTWGGPTAGGKKAALVPDGTVGIHCALYTRAAWQEREHLAAQRVASTVTAKAAGFYRGYCLQQTGTDWLVTLLIGPKFYEIGADGVPPIGQASGLIDVKLAPRWGSGTAPGAPKRRLAGQRRTSKGAYVFVTTDALHLSRPACLTVTPLIKQEDIVVVPGLRSQPRRKRDPSEATWKSNLLESAAVQTYGEELYVHVPFQIALELWRTRNYMAALDWFRSLYDYAQAPAEERWKVYWYREVYRDWRSEPVAGRPAIERDRDWLLDPLNPHALAEVRPQAQLRYLLMSVAECLIDYADSEFHTDTPESIGRARGLYLTALELLQDFELRVEAGPCERLRHRLQLPADASPALRAMYDRLGWELRSVQDTALLENVLPEVEDHVTRGAIGEAIQLMRTRRGQGSSGLSQGQVLSAERRLRSTLYSSLMASPNTLQVLAAANGGSSRSGTQGPRPPLSFCIAPNPLPAAMRLRAELNLQKIRTCRNIAGMERSLEIYSAPTDAVSGLPSLTPSGRISVTSAPAPPPTPYRYEYLLERAKHLADRAAQMEAGYLAALEKYDAERYHVLKARQDLEMARAGVRLQAMREREARDGVKLAELQSERAELQATTLQAWIDAGLNKYEQEMMDAYQQAAAARVEAVALEAAARTLQAIVSAASAQLPAAPAAAANAVLVGATSFLAAGATGRAISAETAARIASIHSSFERRKQEWSLQCQLAQHDQRIGLQQVRLASDRVRIVQQEQAVSQMQADFAASVVEFLNTKFTNAELYAWMSRILGRIYDYFLGQATAVARLSEAQLAFERQESLTGFIQTDYWEVPGSGESTARTNGETPDRRGLTGSARLLADIYKLDQHRFETAQRKLQLVKTISMAQLAPAELQNLRQTGKLVFTTPLALFDHDFPGHYLRLIKRVRTSVVALIPPVAGIRATLSTPGVSRVVVQSRGVFQTITVRRDPEAVALTSPVNATGLFELSPVDGQMLLPFEGLGVEASWIFHLPKASNQFDYNTLADVLFTIEYTALDSPGYRLQVQRALGTTLEGDRPFGFRHQFPDAWYDLHNPEQSQTPMVVHFPIRKEDFPPNVQELQIAQVVLYFARREGEDFEIPVQSLMVAGAGGSVVTCLGAQSSKGKVSTRAANGSAWRRLIGRSPVGEWTLSLASSDGPTQKLVESYFAEEKIEDILLVITFSGRTPPWPS